MRNVFCKISKNVSERDDFVFELIIFLNIYIQILKSSHMRSQKRRECVIT